MITKILFTMAIIAGMVYFTSRQSRKLPARTTVGYHPLVRKWAPLRLLAYGVIVLMVTATALWLVMEWRAAHEVLSVRVINGTSGAATEYEAYRSDIESRSFRTLDGRRVVLADTERLEVMDP